MQNTMLHLSKMCRCNVFTVKAVAQTTEVPEIQEIYPLSPSPFSLYLSKGRFPKFNLQILSYRQHMERREKNLRGIFPLIPTCIYYR